MNRFVAFLIAAVIVAGGIGALPNQTRMPLIVAPANGAANTETPTVTSTIECAATGTATSTGTATAT